MRRRKKRHSHNGIFDVNIVPIVDCLTILKVAEHTTLSLMAAIPILIVSMISAFSVNLDRLQTWTARVP